MLAILIFPIPMAKTLKKPTLYYVYDALCGWCFGFAPVIEKVSEKYKADMRFEVLSGGMVTGPRIGPIAEMATYIKKASPRVTEVSGQVFGDAFLNGVLNSRTYISNSVPPAIAFGILKESQPEQAITFMHAIQNLLFKEGKDLNELETYLPLASQAGIPEKEFRKKFADPVYTSKAEQEFQIVQNWGISGFPAVVLEKDDKLYLLAQGYQPYEVLTETLEKVLNDEITQ
jgi:putative protein-disulfide isomerase